MANIDECMPETDNNRFFGFVILFLTKPRRGGYYKSRRPLENLAARELWSRSAMGA
jgi:hypothetical protein